MQSLFQKRRIRSHRMTFNTNNEAYSVSQRETRLPSDSTTSDSTTASSLSEKIVERKDEEATSARPPSPSRQHSFSDACVDAEVEPRSWRPRRRFLATSIIFLDVLVLGWTTSCDSNIIVHDAPLYGVSQEAEVLPTALFMLGTGIGSLVAGPLSETTGRNLPYLIAGALRLCFTLGSALGPNFPAQVTFRFLCGLASGPTMAAFGGSLADMFTDYERASIWPLFSASPMLGPVLSPIATGWIAGHVDWRWAYWVALTLQGLVLFAQLLFLEETYSPLLRRWLKSNCVKGISDSRQGSISSTQEPFRIRLWESMKRPAKFWATEPIIMSIGFYLVWVSTVNFTFLGGFDFIFKKTYQLSEGLTSLSFSCIAIGAVLGILSTPAYWSLQRLLQRRWSNSTAAADARDDEPQSILRPAEHRSPELTLVPAAIAAPFLVVSLFALAWLNFPSVSPLASYGATIMFGFAYSSIFISVSQYIIDAYETSSSSAMASITFVRYMISTGMIVATRSMYEGLGVHLGCSVLAILALLILPAPFWLIKCGACLRNRSPYVKKD